MSTEEYHARIDSLSEREQRLETVAKMTLLFHSGDWGIDKHNEWIRCVAEINPDSWRLRSVGHTHIPNTTTKMLCDCVRKALEP